MKNGIKRFFAVWMAMVMLISIAPLSGFLIKSEAASYKVGDTFVFGNYPQTTITDTHLKAKLAEQDYDSKGIIHYNGDDYIRIGSNYYGYLPIVWRVLSVDSDGIYVMAENVLDSKCYNSSSNSITWADCTLRQWLNNDFYNMAFTSSEKSKINLTHLVNGDNPDYGTEGGVDTYDKVWIPSIADVTNPAFGFPSNYDYSPARRAQPTQYAIARGVSYDSGICALWWLRTPGSNSYYACYVYYNGLVIDGTIVDYIDLGIRPALKLNLSSSIYQSKAKSNYQIKVVDDTTRKPISGAQVTFNGGTSTTSANGIAAFSTNASTSSTAAVKITKDGYAAQTVRLYELNPYGENQIALSSASSPLSMALADISIKGTDICGPSVSIMGKSFPLFKTSANINIPLSKITKLNVSGENDTKNKTVKFILGVKPGYSLDSDAKRNEDYQNFKRFYQSAVGGSNQNALNKYNSLRNKLQDGDGSLGFSCGIKFAGYLQFSYATGNMVLQEGGIVITAEASVSTDVPFAGICYATFKIGGEIEGGLTIKQGTSGMLDASAKISLSVKPTIGVGAKLLSKDIASVEAGIDGKITGSVKIPASSFANAFEASLSAQCYVKAKALWIFEHKWSTNFPSMQLYPNFGQFDSAGIDIIMDDEGNIIVVEDESDLKLIDRSYLNKASAPKKAKARAAAIGGLNEASVYPYGNPKLVQLADGRVMALFLYDDGSKSDINRTTLYYSIYENSTWSNPVPVNNSGFADFPAEVCTDGTNVYAVWGRASQVLEDSYSVDDVADKTELVYAQFDGTSWSAPTVIDTAGKYQMLYSIAQNNGEVAVLWAENSNNDYMLASGTTSLYYKTLSEGTWSDSTTAASNRGIADAAIGYESGTLKVLYSLDADGDLTTANDSELYLNGSKITDNEVDEGELTYQNGEFYWIQDGELHTRNGSTGAKVESDYRVLSNGSSTAVTSLLSDGFKNELMVSYLNGDTYTEPAALTSYGKHISYYDAILNGNGTVSLLADVENLSGSDDYPYSTTDMVCDIISGRTDLAISDVTYDGTVSRGGMVQFTGTVTNNGTTPVNGYTVTFKNANGAVIRSADLNGTLQPGESKTFTVNYSVPNTFTKQTITAEVSTSGDADASNNSGSFTMGYADVEIVNATISESGTITATIVNNGYEAAQNVKLKVSAFKEEATELTTLNVGNIGIGETKTVTYTVSGSNLAFDSAYVVNKFILNAATDTEEENLANNDYDVIYAPTPVQSIALNTSTLALEYGNTAQLVATVYPSDAYNKSVHWLSDSIDVVTVDDNGNLTTVGAGTAIITAITDDGGFVAQCEVTVSVRATSVELDNSNITLNVGNTITLTANVKPGTATDKTVAWTSSDISVATVDDDGNVRGLKTGTAIITARTNDGGFEASCTVNVVNAVNGITISENSASLYTGKTKQLYASVTPADADNQQIVWTTDNDAVAEVSANGLVTAVGSGTAVITAMSVDGNYTSTCTVTVGKHVTSVFISDSTLSLPVGFSEQLTATVFPFSALNKTVYWMSTNTKVATVDEGGYVTAVKPGSTTIIVYTEDGEYAANCTVTVTNSVGGFSLSDDEIYVARNSTKQLTGVFSPATAENKNVTWSSTNSTIATVDENGLVTGKMAGTVMIVATTEDGGFKDYCSVKVVGVDAISTAHIDFDSGIITGLDANLDSLDEYITVSDSSCELQYESLGTDAIVYLTRNDEIIDAYTVVIFGDVNGDGWYDGQDSFIVNCLANGLLSREQVGEAKWMAADCNHDGEINSSDVLLLEQAGLLLANVDQTMSQEELMESDSYIEYLNLIDQNPAGEEPIPEEPAKPDPAPQTFLVKLIEILQKVITFIRSLFPKI